MTQLDAHIEAALTRVNGGEIPTAPRITEMVLVIEHRVCSSCGTDHTVPNPKILGRTTAARTSAAHLQPIEKMSAQTRESLSRSTPCSKLHVHTTCQVCHLCFDTYAPAGQFELFHEREDTAPKAPKKVRQYPPVQDKPKKVLTLADF